MLDQIYGVECEMFSPCALGSAINDATMPQLECKVVAGAANNQLAEPRHGAALHARGILYAPDYVINAGGLINIAEEALGRLRPGPGAGQGPDHRRDPDRGLRARRARRCPDQRDRRSARRGAGPERAPGPRQRAARDVLPMRDLPPAREASPARAVAG